jgi:hypothetical protein
VKWPSFGETGLDGGLVLGDVARKGRVFITLFGLAGPLLKRYWEYTVSSDPRI